MPIKSSIKALAIAVAVSLVGCSDTEEPIETTTPEGWVTVNGSPINEAELDHAVNKFFGDQFVDARAEANIRKSLIASRALAQQSESTLSEARLAEIETAVNAYREERLIAALIEDSVTPEPVSASDVNEYYQAHLTDFGATTVKRLSVLKATLSESSEVSVSALRALSNHAELSDWQAQPLTDGLELLTMSSLNQLSPSSISAINALEGGGQSGVIKEGSSAFVFKVTAIEKIPAKPLSEVSSIIRKRLSAMQLKKVVKALSETAVNESEIVKYY